MSFTSIPSSLLPQPSGTNDLENRVDPSQQLQQLNQPPPQAPPQQPQADPYAPAEQYYTQKFQQNQQVPPSGGPVRRLLQNFFSGMGTGMMHQAGVPTPEMEQQDAIRGLETINAARANVSNVQAQVDLHRQVLQNSMRQPTGPGLVPFGIPIGTQMTATEQVQAMVKANQVKLANEGKVDVQDLRNQGAQAAQGPSIPLTPQQAQSLGLAPGTTSLPLKQYATAVSTAVKPIGYQAGETGPYEVNKLTGTTKPLNIGNPRAVFVQNRQYAALDTLNGNAPVYANPIQIARDPGRYMPAGAATTALNKQNLMEDIRGNVQQVRTSLTNLDTDFTPAFKAQMAIALRSTDPRSAIQSLVNSVDLSTLSGPQQEAMIAMTNLVENALAMRTVLGAGQGSEDLRSAIQAVIPGPKTPSKAYGLKQLDYFERTLDRLERGVPRVPLGGTTPPSSSGATSGFAAWKAKQNAR